MIDLSQLAHIIGTIGGMLLPFVVLFMIFLGFQSRRTLITATHHAQMAAAKMDLVVANIEIVRHATNSLMEEQKRAAEVLAYAAGVKAGLRQEDAVMEAARKAALLVLEASDRAAALVQSAATAAANVRMEAAGGATDAESADASAHKE